MKKAERSSWPHTHTSSFTVTASRSFLTNLHSNANVYFFLGERPEGEGDAADGADSDPAKEQHYAGSVALDVSPLFAANTQSVAVRYKALATSDAEDLSPQLPVPPAGFSELQVVVSVDKPLLTPELSKELNPLTVTLRHAVDLPGVHLAEGDPSLKRFVTPTKYDDDTNS